MLGGGLLVVSLIAIYIVVIWLIINETENGDGRVGLLALRNSPRRRSKSMGTLSGHDNTNHPAKGGSKQALRRKPATAPGYLKTRPGQNP